MRKGQPYAKTCGIVTATVLVISKVASLTSPAGENEPTIIQNLAATTNTAGEETRRLGAYGIEPNSSMSARIKEPTPGMLSSYHFRGGPPASPHQLSTTERLIVEDALQRLPALQRRVLADHLAGIYFADGIPVSANTSPADQDNLYPLFNLIINATVLKLNVSEWLTQKERTCYSTNASSFSVSIDCGTNLNALVYILLHEATHMVDYSENFTPAPPPQPPLRPAVRLQNGNIFLAEPLKRLPPIITPTAFTANVWTYYHLPVPQYCFELRERVGFYHQGGKLPMEDAVELYTALGKTPFASLYGSLNWMDDLAEYLTVYHLTEVVHQPYCINVFKDGKPVMSYEPMKSPLVRQRVQVMRRFYEP